jgi:hypothetical protein
MHGVRQVQKWTPIHKPGALPGAGFKVIAHSFILESVCVFKSTVNRHRWVDNVINSNIFNRSFGIAANVSVRKKFKIIIAAG